MFKHSGSRGDLLFGAFVKNGMTPDICVPDSRTCFFTLRPVFQLAKTKKNCESNNYVGSDQEGKAAGIGNFLG